MNYLFPYLSIYLSLSLSLTLSLFLSLTLSLLLIRRTLRTRRAHTEPRRTLSRKARIEPRRTIRIQTGVTLQVHAKLQQLTECVRLVSGIFSETALLPQQCGTTQERAHCTICALTITLRGARPMAFLSVVSLSLSLSLSLFLSLSL